MTERMHFARLPLPPDLPVWVMVTKHRRGEPDEEEVLLITADSPRDLAEGVRVISTELFRLRGETKQYAEAAE